MSHFTLVLTHPFGTGWGMPTSSALGSERQNVQVHQPPSPAGHRASGWVVGVDPQASSQRLGEAQEPAHNSENQPVSAARGLHALTVQLCLTVFQNACLQGRVKEYFSF